jgi:HD-like signal output (HDOD) protein
MTTPANEVAPAGAAAPSAEATLALLWERVRQRGDMPGFTKAIGAILGAIRGEEEHEFNMAKAVLSDPVLTQKVLKLANSGMYSAFGQRIHTVSKAIQVLGGDAIGHLALGLKLIEEISQASDDPSIAHIEMEKAVLAGIVAQQVAEGSLGGRDAEEAVVCSMLHALGRMMVTFYMPEAWASLRELGGEGREDDVTNDVLGMSMEQIGSAAAERWSLPRKLIDGMRRIVPGEVDGACSDDDWLAAVSTMSSQCATLLWQDDAAGAAQVQALAASFSSLLGVETGSMLQAIDKAKVIAAADLSIAPLSKPAERRAKALATKRMRDESNRILIDGVAALRKIADTAGPGQMLTMALETVYQGMTFSRAVAFLRNRKEHKYSAKVGFGEGVKELLHLLAFDEGYEPNVFHASLNSDRVIFIENAREPKFTVKLPAWWKSNLSEARSFVILPLCANGQPVGFMYGDWDESFPQILLSQTEFGLLNDVRGLVVSTVERRQQVEVKQT